MAGKADKIKGRAKEAAGALTDDPALKREGKLDQAEGKAKQAAEDVKDAAKRTIGKARDAVNRD